MYVGISEVQGQWRQEIRWAECWADFSRFNDKFVWINILFSPLGPVLHIWARTSWGWTSKSVPSTLSEGNLPWGSPNTESPFIYKIRVLLGALDIYGKLAAILGHRSYKVGLQSKYNFSLFLFHSRWIHTVIETIMFKGTHVYLELLSPWCKLVWLP